MYLCVSECVCMYYSVHTFVDPKVVVGSGCYSNLSVVGTVRYPDAKFIRRSFGG